MDQVNPTRMNLLLRRGQIRLARQGADLLNRKKDALLREFYAEAAAVASRRETLIEILRREAVACVVAEACAGPESLASAAAAAKTDFRLRLIPKNLWGVRIVDLEHSFRPVDPLARAHSPRSTSLAIDETAAGFEQIVLDMLELAPRELRLRRIGEDIRRTNRKINALEQQVIPRLEAQARFISQTLEERARDDVIRLKRLKTKKARGSAMRLLDLVQGRLVVPQMRSRTKWEAIEELVDKLVEEHEIRIFDREEVLEAVVAKERQHSTGLGQGIALPHSRTGALEDPVAVLGVAPEGIPFESVDGQDARLICLLMIPEGQYGDHIKTIADVTRLLSDARFRAQLIAAARTGNDREVLDVIKANEGPGFLAD